MRTICLLASTMCWGAASASVVELTSISDIPGGITFDFEDGVVFDDAITVLDSYFVSANDPDFAFPVPIGEVVTWIEGNNDAPFARQNMFGWVRLEARQGLRAIGASGLITLVGVDGFFHLSAFDVAGNLIGTVERLFDQPDFPPLDQDGVNNAIEFVGIRSSTPIHSVVFRAELINSSLSSRNVAWDNLTIQVVPLPSSVALLLTALAGLGFARKKVSSQ